MFVILTYDVGVKRVAKVMKVCRRYLSHEQKSVFEGGITERELHHLKDTLSMIIDTNSDHISIYEFQTLRYTAKESIGVVCNMRGII